MLVSIMQPYFFPYIGYFQLMVTCDVFVVSDAVQYIRGGWINRNRILVNGEPKWITLPVAGADYFLPINQREYLLQDRVSQRLRRRIIACYRTAPNFPTAMAVIEEILAFPETNVAVFNTQLLRRIAAYIGITTPIRIASEIHGNRQLAGQEQVIDLCMRLGASSYVNPIGGLDLYQSDRFRQNNLELRFLKSQASPYAQFGMPHVGSLSIIDVMMFNDVSAIRRMLGECQLIAGPHELHASARC